MTACGHLGVVSLGIHGVSLPNSPSNPCLPPGFLIFQKPLSIAPLDRSLVKQRWVFDARNVKFRVSCNLANIEAPKFRSLAKDLQFSPTFSEYVKVMESVKLDRSRNVDVDLDGYSSKKRLKSQNESVAPNGGVGKKLASRRGQSPQFNDNRKKKDREEVGLIVERPGQEQRNGKIKAATRVARIRKPGAIETGSSGWGLVEDLLKKKNLRSNGRTGNELDEYKGQPSARSSCHVRNPGKGWTHLQDNVDEHRFDTKDRRQCGYHRQPSATRKPVVDNHGGKKKVGRFKEPREMKKDTIDNNLRTYRRMESGSGHTNYGDISHVKASYMESTRASEHGGDLRENINKGDCETVVAQNRNRYPIKVDKNMNLDENRKFIFIGRDKRVQGTEENEISRDELSPKGYAGARKYLSQTKDPSTNQMHMEHRVKFDVFTRDMNGAKFDDRAAFRTFEIFTDVRNRPRVLRKEMEERIQKLASRLNSTDINKPEWQFSKMMHGAKIKFSDHTILRVVQILGRFGNWKRVLQVVEWLQSRERFKSYKSRYIYTTALDVLGKARRPFEALNIFHTMREELSSYPDLAAYHCIAVTLGQAGLMKELLDVIDCMRAASKKKFNLGPLQRWDPRLEPDLIVYNSVLNACVQQKQWEGAFWVLQQLKQQGIRPTNATYGLVMEVMLACGKYNLVYEFFKKVEKSSIPGVLNYKVLINALWREKKVDEAVMAVKDMEKRGIVGSASLYYDLARCLCSAGRCQEALLQIDKICKVANKPLVVTYTGLIQACIDSGSIENAKYIFNQMHKYCSPNTVTCNIMLKSYIESRMFEEAKALFFDILEGTHWINSKTDLNRKAILDKFTFNNMMEACAETGNWEDFENTFEQMLHHGYHFDTRRHLRMVLDALRAGKGRVLEATWKHLLSFGRVPPPPLIMERFCLKLKEGDHAAAISCIRRFGDTGASDIPAKSWSHLLLRDADCLKEETVLQLVGELSSNIGALSSNCNSVYQNILGACREFLCNVKYQSGLLPDIK